MRSRYLSLLVLVAAPGMPGAQTTATLRTQTEISALAFNTRNALPPSTTITTPQSVTALDGINNNHAQASATMAAPDPLSMTLDTRALVTTVQNVPMFAADGGTLSWTLAGGGYGQLTIAVDLYLSYTLSGGDGTTDLSITGPGVNERHSRNVQQRTTYPIAFTNTFELRIGFGTSINCLGLNQYAQGRIAVQIDFAPLPLPPIQQRRYGTACGATLGLTDTPMPLAHVLAIDAAGGTSSGVFVLVFGVRRANVPLPGSPCSLLAEPAVALVLMADSSGAIHVPVSVPGPLASSPLDLQAIALDPAAPARASDGVEFWFADM